MNVERLTLLRDLLRRPVPVPGIAGFYIDGWSYPIDRLDPSVVQPFADATCGTTCCALGLAGVSPEFRALGFFHDPDRMETEPPFQVHGQPMQGIDAAMAFFDIDGTSAVNLFIGSEWYWKTDRVPFDELVKTTDVADAIDDLLKNGRV